MFKVNIFCFTILSLLILTGSIAYAQKLDDFEYRGSGKPAQNPVINEYQFNGYTNHWHNSYQKWIRNGNLFKMSIDNVEKSILQSKVDIAEDMGLPGLIMQEGFFQNLTSGSYQILDQPDKTELEKLLESGNVLVFINPKTPLGKELTKGLSDQKIWPEVLKSHQYGASDLKRINAYFLQKEDKNIFVVSSEDDNTRNKFRQLIGDTENIIQKYDLHKGWFGAYSLLKSVTITPGHPLEIIGKGMNEGNSWFVFDGYMDFLAKDELNKWMKEVNLPIVTDVGYSKLYGCDDYDDFQVQRMFTKETWFDYAKQKNGYVFRNVYSKSDDPYHYDGYIAQEGNKEQIDNEDVPFILKTGKLEDNALPSMVLFLDKGKTLTRKNMWDAILDRREVGILAQGKMMGPAKYRNALQVLLLDRVFLEEYFGDRIDIDAVVEGYELKVSVKNNYANEISGSLELTLPEQLIIENSDLLNFSLPAKSNSTYIFQIQPDASAMGRTNPIAIHCKWGGKEKSIVAMLDLPPAISVHQLLYGHSPKINFPVTVHNFSKKTSFPVQVQVVQKDDDKKVIFESEQLFTAKQGSYQEVLFELMLPPGAYKVRISALGQEYVSQLGVGEASGNATVRAIDLDGDGNNEFQMENDSVQVTLIPAGARVIEYIVKSRNDNIFSKIWPEKAIDDKRPFRDRGFYPYGGFEDFLGQGSMETHTIYEAEIVRQEGDFVRVKMWTDYFGNRLEKIVTLYGNSPLLEVRFVLNFKDPYANVLGPQPILELGERHWTEDVFTIPTVDGLKEIRMTPERRWGQLFYMSEGWNAGYDIKEDVNFVGAFPVSQPLFLHMFLNDPGNKSSHHYYAEFQPWVPIIQKSTMYFSYYIWGAGGPWENGVNGLRQRNLITKINH